MAFDYVKFRRGNTDAFSALNPKDPNTLYFVYANVESKKGLLYLGDKLIGGGEFSELVGVDVENAQPGDILYYTNIGSAEEPEWVWQAIDPESLPLIPEDAIMPEGSNLDPGDTLSQAIMKLDEAIGNASHDTWRAIQVEGVEALSNAIDSGDVNFAAGDGLVLTAVNGTITINFSEELGRIVLEIVNDNIADLPIFSKDGPGLVPSTEDIQPENPDDPTFNSDEYVLTAGGNWVHISQIAGPFWEEMQLEEMPNLSGMIVADALNQLEALGFTQYEIRDYYTDEVYASTRSLRLWDLYVVNHTNPEAGAAIKDKPENIFVTIYCSNSGILS